MDRELVERAQNGDREAYEALAAAVADRLYATAYRLVQDSDVAHDATQLALVSIWTDLPSLRDPARFDAWAYRLVVRECLTDLRRRRRRPVVQLPLAGQWQAMPGGGCGAGGSEYTTHGWVAIYDTVTGAVLQTPDPLTGAAGLPFDTGRNYRASVLLPDGRVALIEETFDNQAPNAVDIVEVAP